MTSKFSLRNVFKPAGSTGLVKARRPLTAGQHILRLLLTVLTAGLWLPVRIFRAFQGNVTWEEPPQAHLRRDPTRCFAWGTARDQRAR